MNKNRYYKSRSANLVAFLYAKGHPIVGVENVGKDIEYTLPRTPYVEELVELYRFGPGNHPDLLVQVRDFQQAERQLEKLTQVNTTNEPVS